jgi:uncharacterized protein (TIGR02231 family)
MKSILLLFPTLFAFTSFFSQQDVVMPIISVEIHQEGAVIEHSKSLQLNHTHETVIIKGLASDLVLGSLSIDLPNGTSIESLHFESKYRPTSRAIEINNIKDSIRIVDLKRRMQETILHALTEERAFLAANRSIGGSQEVLLVDDVIEMADFLRDRNQTLSVEILDVTLKIEDLVIESSKLLSRKNALDLIRSEVEGVLTLDLKNSIISRSNKLLTIKYLSPSAYWSPEYEVNFSSNGILVKRFASIAQTSGLTWSATPITLVSGRPSGSLNPIPFEDWILDSSKPTASYQNSAPAAMMRSTGMGSYDDEVSRKEVSFVGKARHRFELETSSVISGNGKPSRVEIDEFPLEGDIRYLAAPAINSEAYTTARIADWSGKKLMDGRAQIIADNSYLGSINLNLPVIGDTLVISLGSNPHVLCSRELSNKNSKSSFLSRKKVVSTWMLAVENFQSDSISVDLVDAIPYARYHDGDIEVLVEVSEGGRVDHLKHRVIFPLDLAPNERREVSVIISVMYPRNRRLKGL